VAVEFDLSPHVRAASSPEATVLLDLRSGKYFALNAGGTILWQTVAAGASRDQALSLLAERFSSIPVARLERDADALLGQLRDHGLLLPRGSEGIAIALTVPPIDRSEPRGPYHAGDGGNAEGLGWALWAPLAFVGLLVSDVLLKFLGFSRFHRLIRRIPTRKTGITSGAERARRIVAGVDTASALYFKRAWCLQRSAVTLALLRLAGLPARLVIGIQRLPFSAHAWVELDGRVVNDQESARRAYTVLETC
jgi:hypothetical protein